MSKTALKRRRVGLFGFLCLAFAVGGIYGQPRPVKVGPEALLPESSLIYVRYDGMKAHSATFDKTAAHDALYKSQLIPVITQAIRGLAAQAPPDAQAQVGSAAEILLNTVDQGISVGITIDMDGKGPPSPWGTIVLHGAGKLEPKIAKALAAAFEGEANFKSGKVGGKTVTSGRVGDSPVEVGWWVEGDHLVAAFGLNAVQNGVAVATGKRPNVSASEAYKKYSKATGFESVTTAWFDLGTLRGMFGSVPIPTPGVENPKTVADAVETLGLGGVGLLVYQGGIKDRSLWTEVQIEATGEKKGLLTLSNGSPITLADLPPLPADCSAFAAGSSDWGKSFVDLISMAKGIEEFIPEREQWGTEQVLEMIQQQLGVNFQDELFESLGPVSCLYYDGQLPLLMDGAVAVSSVKDAEKLEKTIDRLLGIVKQAAQGEVDVRQVKKGGEVISVVEIKQAGWIVPTFCVTDKWFIVAATPQPVEAFLLRVSGKLPSWKPTPEILAGLKELPKDVSSISMRDPRSSVKFAVSLAPFAAGMLKTGLAQARRFSGNDIPAEFPLSIADLPPAEVVSQPLFPNLSVTQSTESGIKFINRSSLPGLIESGPAVAAIGTALLLPAVQQARMAARRTQSMNNMKMLGLAMHNYHDTFNHFPTGARESKDDSLKPDERLSWMFSILPYEEQAALYNQMEADGKWNSDQNDQFAQIQIPSYLNPNVPTMKKDEYAVTHYVGVAGLTEKGPTAKANDPIAGIFAYDRKTSFRDVTDGTSNTAMVVEVSKDLGPWAQGGKATIRPFTKKPYLNGPDGFGGALPGVTGVLMGDGSVRSVSNNADASVIEAIATMAGGEVVNDF
jgi:hypothetical protein